jgi:hypothetical protein
MAAPSASLIYRRTSKDACRKILNKGLVNILHIAGRRWLTPVTLATLEAEIRRITVWDQPPGK